MYIVMMYDDKSGGFIKVSQSDSWGGAADIMSQLMKDHPTERFMIEYRTARKRGRKKVESA